MTPASSDAIVVAVGDELLRGETIDTNGAYLGAELGRFGVAVVERRVVRDDRSAISTAIERALQAAPLVIVTGGLGPTVDDLTVAALRDAVGGRELTEVPNAVGTAPGLFAAIDAGRVLALPGPPRELRAVFEQAVALLDLREQSDQATSLVVAGVPESVLARRLDVLRALPVDVAFYAGPGQVRVRLSGAGTPEAAAGVRELLGDAVFDDAGGLAPAAVVALRESGRSLAVAESLTGGMLAAAVTDVPGASDVLRGGVVAYAEAAKREILGLEPQLLESAGTVDPQVAAEMAVGVAGLTGADLAIATTGVAGPTAHSGREPGTVFVAWAGTDGVATRELRVPGDRDWVRQVTVAAALDGARRIARDLPLWEQDGDLWR